MSRARWCSACTCPLISVRHAAPPDARSARRHSGRGHRRARSAGQRVGLPSASSLLAVLARGPLRIFAGRHSHEAGDRARPRRCPCAASGRVPRAGGAKRNAVPRLGKDLSRPAEGDSTQPVLLCVSPMPASSFILAPSCVEDARFTGPSRRSKNSCSAEEEGPAATQN